MTQHLSVHLEGHLTRAKLASALTAATTARAKGAAAILVDASEMISYDLDARHAFVEWIREAAPSKVAILTERGMWRMVIAAMGMAATVPMQAFGERDAAERWLSADDTSKG